MTKDEALKMCFEYIETNVQGSKFASLIKKSLVNEALDRKAENARELGLDYEPEQEPCGGCGGSGWVTRDPDIGTDQECFVCGGSGAKPEQDLWAGATIDERWYITRQPEQEPVAWVCYGTHGHHDIDFLEEDVDSLSVGTKLYTTPPQRKPLTRGQIREIEVDVSLNPSFDYITPAEQLCRAIEAAHGIIKE